MPKAFPGMDPYLERPGLWEQIHTQLIVDLARELTRQVTPRYWVAIEQRTYIGIVYPGDLAGIPDAAVVDRTPSKLREAAAVYPAEPEVVAVPMDQPVIERYLEIRDPEDQAVITAIELLSPTNKLAVKGRTKYAAKRRAVLESLTNFVEIDLLRAGKPMELASMPSRQSDYRILISRAHERPRSYLYQFGIRDPIPVFPVPLRAGETEPHVDLNGLLITLYDLMHYDRIIDYTRAADPPLTGDDAAWADALLRERSLRE